MITQHFFAPGQSVRFANASRFTRAAPGEYKITRLEAKTRRTSV